MFALEAANDIPKGPAPSSWDWERLAAFPIAGAVGAILAFVLALAVAAVKRALGKSPKTAKWAARFLGYVPEVPPGPVTVPTAGARAVLLLALAAVAGGAAGGLVLGVGEQLAVHLERNKPTSTALVLSIAPLWFVISYNIGDAVFLGLTVRRPSPKGRQHWSDHWGDEEREWVARTGGYLMVVALGFSILCLLTLFGPYLILAADAPVDLGTVVILILSALASIGLAASPLSTHFGTATKETRLPVRTILLVATPILSLSALIRLWGLPGCRNRCRVTCVSELSKQWKRERRDVKRPSALRSVPVLQTRGIAGPKGMPEPIVSKLRDVLKKAMEDPEHVSKLESQGLAIKIMVGEEYAKYFAE